MKNNKRLWLAVVICLASLIVLTVIATAGFVIYQQNTRNAPETAEAERIPQITVGENAESEPELPEIELPELELPELELPEEGSPELQPGVSGNAAGEPEELQETEEEIQAYWEEKNYPPPEYAFKTEDMTLRLPGLSREYTLAWVSDLHMVTDHEPGEGVIEEKLKQVRDRYEELPVTKDGIHAEDLWDDVVDFLNYGRFDAVIFGGDMMDYCSVSNVERLKEGFARLDPRIRILYLRADHDYGCWYGGMKFKDGRAKELHREIDGDAPEDKRMLFGNEESPEFAVIGVNDSTLNLTDDALARLKGWYKESEEKGYPVIACTHVPYASIKDSSLKKLSMKVRNEVYYWNSDGSPGKFIPNGNTWEFMQMLYQENTTARIVLAGHLHASWEGTLNHDLKQHIFGPCFEGNVGIIRVKPE